MAGVVAEMENFCFIYKLPYLYDTYYLTNSLYDWMK